MHVHVICSDGEAKFWLEPEIELAKAHRLSNPQITEIERLIGEHFDEIRDAWQKHFGG